MEEGFYYRHPSCLDVDAYVLAITDSDEESVRLRVAWVNQIDREIIHGLDDIEVRLADLKKWKRV